MPFGVVGGDQVTLTRYGLTAVITTLVGGEPGAAKETKCQVYTSKKIITK